MSALRRNFLSRTVAALLAVGIHQPQMETIDIGVFSEVTGNGLTFGFPVQVRLGQSAAS